MLNIIMTGLIILLIIHFIDKINEFDIITTKEKIVIIFKLIITIIMAFVTILIIFLKLEFHDNVFLWGASLMLFIFLFKRDFKAIFST